MANNAGTRNRPVRTRLPPFSWSYTVITLLCSSPRWLLRKTSYENGRGSALTARTAIGHGHPVDGGGAELDVRRWGLTAGRERENAPSSLFWPLETSALERRG